MKLIIDIPEHIYEHAKEKSEDSNDEWDAMRAIGNGKLLPKGHGRLIDADDLLNQFPMFIDNVSSVNINKTILKASTIIEGE